MSAPEDRERRGERLAKKDSHHPKKRKARLQPYDRDSRHLNHVALEKGLADVVMNQDEIDDFNDDQEREFD